MRVLGDTPWREIWKAQIVATKPLHLPYMITSKGLHFRWKGLKCKN